MPVNQLIIIVGPTASGKTAVGVELARYLRGEIISADSRQIYKLMNIGTAKPTQHDMNDVPHHLLDFLEPVNAYSAGEFVWQAKEIARKIIARNKTPIVVGGSGFYVKTLLEGLPESPKMEKNERSQFIQSSADLSNKKLWEMLNDRLQDYAKTVEVNDRKKMLRALEIYQLTGKMPQEKKGGWEGDSIIFGLDYPREILYNRINQRVLDMVEMGLITEVQSLLDKNIPIDCNAMNSVGYKEAILHLSGKIDRYEMIVQIQKNTRNYAKRQMTWFRNQIRPIWIDANGKNTSELAEIISKKVSIK